MNSLQTEVSNMCDGWIDKLGAYDQVKTNIGEFV
jgi:hypothetical protein